MEKILAVAALALMTVVLSGCGGQSSCAFDLKGKPNRFAPGSTVDVSATLDGLSSDCCSMMKDILNGKTPSDMNACKGTKSISETDVVNGGSCSGTSCDIGVTIAKSTFYGLSDGCCTAFKKNPTMPGDACKGTTKWCSKSTITVPSQLDTALQKVKLTTALLAEMVEANESAKESAKSLDAKELPKESATSVVV